MTGSPAVVDEGADQGTVWLPISEAASRLGLTVDGLRSRIRRGLVRPKRGNDGRLLVPVSAGSPATGHELVEHGASHADVDRDLFDELHAELLELRVSLARSEERLASSERRATDANAVLERGRAERAKAEARADRLEAALAEARRGWLERLIAAARRR